MLFRRIARRIQANGPNARGSIRVITLVSGACFFAGGLPSVLPGTSSGMAIVAAAEPAEDFLARLRAAKYFDTAILYLDRLDKYAGVDGEFKKAVLLEKAQTYVDAARVSRSAAARDDFLKEATTSLDEFLKGGSNPRQAEARLMLGTLQMFRGAQALGVKPDDAARKAALGHYSAAGKTFDEIVATLKAKLTEMQGAKIDAKANPEKAAERDQSRGEYLQALTMAGEARLQAAKTYKDPAKAGKTQLDEALGFFTDLSEKYTHFPPGAVALMSRGLVQEELGQNDAAMDSFIRMLETPDVEDLRDAKFKATSGLIRLSLAEKPPKYQPAIDRGQGMIDTVRPNERRSPVVMQLQVDLAKAYLQKSTDKENQKPADLKRSESEGRQLLIKASKVDGDHVAEANELLKGLGVESESGKVAELPTAEDPTSLDDAYAKAIELYQAAENYSAMLATAKKDNDATKQKELDQKIVESRGVAIRILSRGLAMIGANSDGEVANNGRQLLAFMLYQDSRYRDAAVVGTFLAKNSPGTDMGMKGALIARNSLQTLLVSDLSNQRLISEVKDLAAFAEMNWATHSETPVFQRLVVELSLQENQWDKARAIIEKMSESPTRSLMQRKLGLFLYQASAEARAAGEDAEATKLMGDAEKELRSGLDSIQGNLADEEAMKAALILTKVYLRSDNIEQADKTLRSTKYGPAKLADTLGKSDETFASDLYSTELSLLVQKMTAPGSDTESLVSKANEVMDKLRGSVTGDDAAQRISGIYLRMARDIREQLDTADPAQKTKLIGAFRVFLQRISTTTDDTATLQWIGQTVMELAEASMQPGETKAVGQAADLLGTAIETFGRLKEKSSETPLTVDYQLGRAQRLLGEYKKAIDTLEPVLRKNPNMLNAQIEAATAYEQWGAILPPNFASSSFKAALNGAKPDENRKNVIWGWGKISQLTSGNPKFRDTFFDARYHVALCRYLWGKTTKEEALISKSAGDITQVAALFPTLGGPAQHRKFDQLLKLIQKELGQKPDGLPALPKPALPAG
ncbi:tetratricopeptide repeat protein [Rubripirellula reticaptiva]|uniref:Tetratricopeptide repeat protein n=1 Tax=Rubripirellula reticaptiva TaxID=2528013 RepID=A0A5C6F8S2_9BACT|nr:hypothetical protein [Rubripirellula reticaptiva]TWU56119.1 hypothetical protein Poly59_24230 [Rubripirellula reticaptiva]